MRPSYVKEERPVFGELRKQVWGIKGERGESLIKMRWSAPTDEDGGDAGLMQGPCEREMRLRVAGACGYRFEAGEALPGRFVEVNVLVTRDDIKAGTGFDTTTMLAGEEPGSKRAVGDDGDAIRR